VFTIASSKRLLKREYSRERESDSRVEAGSNTSTVTLRVVGGDEKGSLESETVNYGHESHGSRTPKMSALARKGQEQL
jgi:hypothetical protein